MPENETGQLDSTSPPPKRGHGCFYYGCLTLIVGIIAIGSIFGGIFWYGRKTLAPVCENYFNLIENRNYSAAYQSLGNLYKQKQTAPDFEEMQKRFRQQMGPLQQKSMSGVNISTDTTNGTRATAKYDCTYATGKADLEFHLAKNSGTWVIEGIAFNSPSFSVTGTNPSTSTTSNTQATTSTP